MVVFLIMEIPSIGKVAEVVRTFINTPGPDIEAESRFMRSLGNEFERAWHQRTGVTQVEEVRAWRSLMHKVDGFLEQGVLEGDIRNFGCPEDVAAFYIQNGTKNN